MDPRHFDDLVKRLAVGTTRRNALKVFGGAIMAGTVGRLRLIISGRRSGRKGRHLSPYRLCIESHRVHHGQRECDSGPPGPWRYHRSQLSDGPCQLRRLLDQLR